MTAASEAMVEAMKRELERQQVPFAPFPDVSDGTVVIYHSPAVELDRLARAALSAIYSENERLRGARDFAWTPGAGAYKSYPQYVNLTGNRLTVRGAEFVGGDGHLRSGETVSIDLPPDVLRDFAAALSSPPAEGGK